MDYQFVPIAAIKRSRPLQPRVEQHKETLEKYKLMVLDGLDLDPIELAQYPDDTLHVYHGFTRLQAYKDAGKAEIPARIVVMEEPDAVLLAAGANAKNGRPLSPADVENVVSMLLKHELVRREGWSDGRIAQHVGTYRARVLRIRTHLEEIGEIVPYPVIAQRGDQSYPVARPRIPIDALDEPDDGATYGDAPDSVPTSASPGTRPKPGATTGTHAPGQVLPTVMPLSISIAWSYQDGRDYPSGQAHRHNLTDLPDHIRAQLVADLVAAFGTDQILQDMGYTAP